MPTLIRSNIEATEVIRRYTEVVSRFDSSQQPSLDLIQAFGRSDCRWCEVVLSEDEFLRLETPAGWDNPASPGVHLLLRDVDYDLILNGDIRQSKVPRADLPRKLEMLEMGEDIGHLFIRDKMYGRELSDASFYIEDGFGKSVALKKFWQATGHLIPLAFLQMRA